MNEEEDRGMMGRSTRTGPQSLLAPNGRIPRQLFKPNDNPDNRRYEQTPHTIFYPTETGAFGGQPYQPYNKQFKTLWNPGTLIIRMSRENKDCGQQDITENEVSTL